MAKKEPFNLFGAKFNPRDGKFKRPEEDRIDYGKLEFERAREGFGPGCGNPLCPQCYPQNGMNSGVRPLGAGGARDRAEDEYQRALRAMQDAMRYREPMFITSAPAKPSGPPASYTKARKECENWIVAGMKQSFTDIIGNDEALAQLRDAIEAPVKHKELYEAYSMAMPKGALLSGPPGCGKTMFARAAASELANLYGGEGEFISIAGSELQSPFIGVTEGYIKSIFTFAREYKAWHKRPLLVFMDEAEVLLPDRTGRVRRVSPWEESQVATFLAEMDGMQESGAFVLLASNRPEVIDSAVLRDGRCDFKITIKRPTSEAIQAILTKHFADVPLGEASIVDLVFAALESLYDPHKVLMEGHILFADLKDEKLSLDHRQKHFSLEHIISGAMAVSIPARAKRYAFARDKSAGAVSGVSVSDVVRAVGDLFEENRRLEHSFALEEFRTQFFEEEQARRKLKE